MLAPEHMPDAELQLNDVLKVTEDATVQILQQAGAILAVLENSGVSDEVRNEVQARVNSIYEACSFQDITGQRIKKVLGHINGIGQQLKRLSDLAHFRAGDANPVARGKDPLLNGPQLSQEAPSQNDIDNLFEQA